MIKKTAKDRSCPHPRSFGTIYPTISVAPLSHGKTDSMVKILPMAESVIYP